MMCYIQEVLEFNHCIILADTSEESIRRNASKCRSLPLATLLTDLALVALLLVHLDQVLEVRIVCQYCV
jgi:hypothetical protein